MTIKVNTYRSLAVLAIVVGAAGPLTAPEVHVLSAMDIAITAEPDQSGGVKQGGAGKHYHGTFQQQAPTRTAPGKLTPPRRKCPGAHLPGQTCRKL